MNKAALIILLALSVVVKDGVCQKERPRYFGEPIWTDTLSTLFFPTRYNEAFLSSNKIAVWGDYYANIVVYDYKTDMNRKLFEKDTFIEAFAINNSYYERDEKPKNLTSKWVFLLVKTKDTNASGRIDENDPSVLFAVTTRGENLKQLTGEIENVVSFKIFEKQGLGL